MERLGEKVADLLRIGDLIVLEGPLGAGKTTLVRGLGRGLDASGVVSSPTFVIARRHRSSGTRPALSHVDAYRLAGGVELDDLDLDLDLADSVVVVEWGRGKVEHWSPDRLDISIRRPETPGEHGTPRTVLLQGCGKRWRGTDWVAVLGDEHGIEMVM